MKVRIAMVYLIAVVPPTTEKPRRERGPSKPVATHLH